MMSLSCRLACLGLFLAAGSTGTARSADTSVAPAPVSVPALVAQARQENRSLRAARIAVDISRARLEQAGLRPNPRLELGARSDVLFGNEGEYEVSAGWTQDFPIAGRLLREKELARVDVALAEAEVASAEAQQDRAVADAAYRLYVLDRREEGVRRIILSERGLVDTVRSRFKAAEVSEMDVNTVRLDLQRRAQEQATLQAERDTTLAELNTLLGRAASTPLAVGAPPPALRDWPSLAQLQRFALAHRPDWHRALLGIDRAAAELALARAQRWEDWSLTVGVAQDRQVLTDLPAQDPGRTVGVSVSIPLPLHNSGAGRLTEARLVGDQAQAQLEALRISIDNEVASAFAQAHALQDALVLAEQALPLGERNVHLARLGYSQGLIPVFEVVQAQRQQSEANARYLDLLAQTLSAQARLRSAIGDSFLTAVPVLSAEEH
jgi:cobalt-zinc-cadmium efflux system outer membrane protein